MTDDTQTTKTGSQFDQHIARIAVGAYDDAQDVRTSMMNRVRDIVRKRNEGIPFDAVEDEKEDRNYDSQYKDENLPALVKEMYEGDKLSDHEFEYLREMLEAGQSAKQIEERYKDVMQITEREPIFTEWLEHVNGVSTVLTARLIHRFSYCEDYDRVSNLWSYSGLAPGQSRTKGEKLGYDPQAKTLAWLVADRIIMQGDNSLYKTNFYDPYKKKQERRMERAKDMTEAQLEKQEWTPPESQGHAHNRAVRYLAKKFLKHYWAIARDIQGYDTPDEYIIAHGGHEKKTDTFENPYYAKKQLIQS